MKLILILLMSLGFAHEGHDHDAPTTVKAPKGGIIKSLEDTHVEVLNRKGVIYVYLYDLNMKPKRTKGFKLSAEVKLPRKDKLEQINFDQNDTSFSAQYSPKAHRYDLMLKIFNPTTGHNDKLKYTLEPKR